MAIKVIASCDRCKKQVEAVSEWAAEKQFYPVKIEISQYNNKKFLLCADCMQKYGLISKWEATKVNDIEQATVQDQLFDLLRDIAYDVAEEVVNNNK